MIRVLVADDEEKACQLICKLIRWEELEMKLVGTGIIWNWSSSDDRSGTPDPVLTGYPDARI